MALPLYIGFVWNHHQPLYRALSDKVFKFPWVRLHGTKDYYGIAKLISRYPEIHHTFNLTPVLLDQILDYEKGMKDKYLILSEKAPSKLSIQERKFILGNFFSLPSFARKGNNEASKKLLALQEKAKTSPKEFREEDYLALQTLFNLFWLDPEIIEENGDLSSIVNKKNFSESDRNTVIEYHRSLIKQVIPLYKKLKDNGQAELITTPYYHPILPLLIDSSSAVNCDGGLKLPAIKFSFKEDAGFQIKKARNFHLELFGEPLEGLWPSEQAVSSEALILISESGFKWTVTDENVLSASLGIPLREPPNGNVPEGQIYVTGGASANLYRPDLLYKPYKFSSGKNSIAVLFRDQYLSDLIGFEYGRWDPVEAAEDFLNRLKTIAESMKESPVPNLLTIALDGENAWEGFPDDKNIFLNKFFSLASKESNLKFVTISEYLKSFPPVTELHEIAVGSWNMGNLNRWIGSPAKNKAWELLYKVRHDLMNLSESTDEEKNKKAREEFYAAEGSDYPWWFDSMPLNMAKPFDEIFRKHLKFVYLNLGKEVPEFLKNSII
ncbi:MAG: glycoside hydrolase family 57 protein [Firmicutes bacterium]|nr:glycoside hydrolase family 57 protein [Bacillota bacterium]